MRLTNKLLFRYPKYYYWGWGKGEWGEVKHREHQYKVWKRIIKIKSAKPIPVIPAKVPENAVVENPNKFVESDYRVNIDYNKLHPWPYELKAEEGTPNDPKYKQNRAFIFSRKTVIYEGFKGAANFCHAVIESDINSPQIVNELEEDVDVSSALMDVINRRIDWCQNDDGIITKLQKVREFPRIDQVPMNKFGIRPERKEFNTLSTFCDATDLFASRNFGFVDRRKLLWPKASVTFVRDGKLVICNLDNEFLTVSNADTTTSSNDPLLSGNMLFSNEIKSTIEKPIIDIQPCNWEICFDKSHFYDEQLEYAFAPQSRIHTIYLGTHFNHLKKLVDRFLKARAVMMCYGYTVAEARRRFGNPLDFKDLENYKDIPEPITTQCVFINQSKQSVGFAFFQLNTLSFDSDIKNQIWFSGPYDFNEQREEIVRKLIAIHRLGAPRVMQKQRITSVN
ncbi:hypothetical protein B4U80_00628 [Leptotrombidium deliense]|uniref:Uncharacterized protein n=1 Tax=Leptotrombidium deliense TaxID=299467 RepID=A0A443SGZ4_9ACAR|nr:hypothetical protein B4U80_00628 [Leptotrombidium deliense]